MNKSELVDAVVNAAALSKREAENAVNAVVYTIMSEVKAGRKVSVVGFGSFNPTRRAARTGRNPQTGAAVRIAASKGVRFSPSSTFKSVVNGKATLGVARGTKAPTKPAAARTASKTASKVASKAPAKTASKAASKSTGRATTARAGTAKKAATGARKAVTGTARKAAVGTARKATAATKTARRTSVTKTLTRTPAAVKKAPATKRAPVSKKATATRKAAAVKKAPATKRR